MTKGACTRPFRCGVHTCVDDRALRVQEIEPFEHLFRNAPDQDHWNATVVVVLCVCVCQWNIAVMSLAG
jgi:hypothetical protein